MSEHLRFDATTGADTAITADPSGDPLQMLLERYGHLLTEEVLNNPSSPEMIIIQAIQDCEL